MDVSGTIMKDVDMLQFLSLDLSSGCQNLKEMFLMTKNRELLEALGWNVITVWECSLKRDFSKTMHSLLESLKSFV